jgi:predicted acetyltransferase
VRGPFALLIERRRLNLSVMAVKLRWVGASELDRVALTRARSSAASQGDIEKYRAILLDDPRPQPGDYLLAEDGAEAVGSTTVIPFDMWVRGAPVSCQGVAWVGTIRTRRRRGLDDDHGVASHLMHEVIRAARERGQVVSALMPFRASFYEHFGYGVVERRCHWKVPLSVLPSGPFDGIRYVEAQDREAIAACHQRSVERGQCDLGRLPARWEHIGRNLTDGFEIVDRPTAGGPVRGQLYYSQFMEDEKDILLVRSQFWDDLAAFKRQLHFLASLKDQYHAVVLELPADFPLNWLLKERQLPHRLVNHQTALLRPYTRMQVRVLDHLKLLSSMRYPEAAKGEAVIAVRETEVHISQFKMEISGSHCVANASDSAADIECDDKTWAAIALGDLSAKAAVQYGLAHARNAKAVTLLGCLSEGPVPFCNEYF